MNKNRILNTLMTTTFICGAIGFAAPAYAQDEDQDDAPQAGPVEGAEPDTSADADPDAEDEGDIVVTGSRIPQPNLESVSPVTVVNSQEVKLSGITRTEDLINSLPQAFAGQGGNLANGASGTATVNLRGLGSDRTMVLINGRRLVPGDPQVSVPDINVVPAAIVDRVDVLTGGASSVYGSDAVAGVVNFIMDTDFEGVRLDAQYSFFQHENDADPRIIDALNRRGFPYPGGNVADGGTFDISLAIGAGFDDGRGHVTAYAGYRKLDAVTQAKRDYSACATQARATRADIIDCGGSATSANGTFIVFDDFTSTFFQVGPNRTLIPGFTAYNFNPTNFYQRPDERYVFGAFAEYEISQSLQPYLEIMFMDDRTRAQIAPSGDFGNTFSINCNNPLLSAQQRSIICDTENLVAPTISEDPNTGVISVTAPSSSGIVGVSTVAGNLNVFCDVVSGTTCVTPRPGVPASAFLPFNFIDPTTGTTYQRGFAQILRRNVEGGGREDDLQHTSYRIVAGMRGDLSSIWSYDAYYQFGQTNYASTYSNDFSVTRLGRVMDVIDDPRTPGVDPICRSVLDGSDPSCVPWDIFAVGNVSPEALAYLQIPGLQRGSVQQSIANASVTANLGDYGIKFPWAEEGVGIALGVEYRKENLELQTDAAYQVLPSSDLAGQGAPTLPVEGSFNVKEAFAEARIPIVEESFIHALSLELGYRYSDYDLGNRSVTTDTYKIGAEFAPIRDVRFRGAYNRAVRAPNIQELFAPQRVVLNGNSDPCAGDFNPATPATEPEAPLAACQAMGVSAAQYGNIAGNPAGQYNGLIGGNPNLDPEIADTITLGVVLQPRFLPRLAISADWFDIEIDKAIQGIGQDTILQTCVDTLDPTFCGLVNRDQFGSLWRTGQGFVEDLQQNIGSFSTRGIDINGSYSHELGSLGSLSFSFVGTWLDELITDNGVSEPYDCAGLYGLQCGTPNPEWRHRARLSLNMPDGIGVSVAWRHFGSVAIDRSSDNPSLQGAFSPFNERIPAQNYFDLALTARIGDHYNFRLGVNNIFDRDPPIIGANGVSGVINACFAVFCSGNTYPNVYDALGRYVFAGVTLDF